MDKYNELQMLVTSMQNDINKIFGKKGNDAASVRVRKKLQELKIVAQEVRDEIQLVRPKKN